MSEVTIIRSGPYLVQGSVPLDHARALVNLLHFPISWKFFHSYPVQISYALCRCGQTKTPPFCDGSHQKIAFSGDEVADTTPFNEAMKMIEGPTLSMKDLKSLCVYANFCNINHNVWNQIARPLDKKRYHQALKAIQHCPSGRLVPVDTQSKTVLEPDHVPSISIIEENGYIHQGAIWVKGGIPIKSSQGFYYEVRNRVTLCRCGKSSDMPFCDGKHLLNPPPSIVKGTGLLTTF